VIPRLKILFICAMNKRRSVTAEQLYRNDARVEVRSAGLRTGANRRVSEGDLRWADVVFVMERDHKQRIAMRFEGLELPRMDVLDIPDEFELMDPALVEMLRLMLDPEIDHLLAARGA
jgi:protein-tyrosine phosphatase